MTPEVKGQAPSKRCQNTMTHLPFLNSIVIYGGRNDKEGNNLGGFLDVSLLQLETLEWIEVTTRGSKMIPRFSHTAVSLGSRLLVFGGLNFTSFMNSHLETIEFDQLIAKRLVREEDERLAKKGLILNDPTPIAEANSQPYNSRFSSAIANLSLKVEKSASYLPVPTKGELQSGQRATKISLASIVQTQSFLKNAVRNFVNKHRAKKSSQSPTKTEYLK